MNFLSYQGFQRFWIKVKTYIDHKFNNVLFIEEYDTDDGWHVRKFSDGYIEMISTDTLTMELNDWAESGTGFCKDNAFTWKNYPVRLTTFYGSFPSLLTVGHGYGAWTTVAWYSDNLYRTDGYAIWRFTKPNTSKIYTLKILVVGRWKS